MLVKMNCENGGGGGEIECAYYLKVNGLASSVTVQLLVGFYHYDGSSFVNLVNNASYVTQNGVIFTEGENEFTVSYSNATGYFTLTATTDIEISSDLSTWTTLTSGSSHDLGYYNAGGYIYVKKKMQA